MIGVVSILLVHFATQLAEDIILPLIVTTIPILTGAFQAALMIAFALTVLLTIVAIIVGAIRSGRAAQNILNQEAQLKRKQ